MAAKDTPTVHLSIAKVKKETKVAEPFGIGLSDGKVIYFPDFYAMESEQAEELLDNINARQSNWKVLNLWLSKEDADALRDEKLSTAQLVKVIATATQHYENFYGTPGNSIASGS